MPTSPRSRPERPTFADCEQWAAHNRPNEWTVRVGLADGGPTMAGGWAGRLGVVYSLLFIEDDDQIRLALSMALEDEGYTRAPGRRTAPPGSTAFDERRHRPRPARPAAARHVGVRRLPGAAGPQHRADHHRHGPDRHPRPGGRARGGGRRLRHQAGRRQGAGGADPGAAAPGAAARARRRRGRLHFGDVELRREQGIVLKARPARCSLTKTEFRLLCEFADHAGSVLSRDQLLERVWGYEYLGDSRLVDAHVRRPARQDRGPARRTRSSSPSAVSATGSS